MGWIWGRVGRLCRLWLTDGFCCLLLGRVFKRRERIIGSWMGDRWARLLGGMDGNSIKAMFEE